MNQDAQTRTTAARYVGDWPRIGIRPAIDGRRRGVRESLEEQTMGQARRTADLLSANLRYPDGQPVECVIADTCIGGVAEAAHGAEKFRREGVGADAHRHALLVLRLRNDGHGPAHAQSGVGLQRHRASRRGLSGRGAGRPHTERAARLRHLRPRRAGQRRRYASRRRAGEAACALPAPVWRWRSCAARLISRWAASRWASQAPSSISRSSRDYLGMRVEMRRHDRDHPPHRRRHLRRRGVRAGLRVDAKPIARKARTANPPGKTRTASRRSRNGKRRSR